MDWKQKLERTLQDKNVILLGVGNELKADDGLGYFVFNRLNTKNKLFCGEMPENFIGKVKKLNPEIILIIDCIDFQGKPGEILFTDASNADNKPLSTHSLSFTLFSKMLPNAKVFLLGVQPVSLEFGAPMSVEVKTSAEEIVVFLNSIL